MGVLLNRQLRDGSRVFGELELRATLAQLRDHARRLPGATITGFVGNYVAEGCVDFEWEGQTFSIGDRAYAYLFFVGDGACPEPLLHTVLTHFERLAS